MGKGNLFYFAKWQESQGCILFWQGMRGKLLAKVCILELEAWPSLRCQVLKEFEVIKLLWEKEILVSIT